jgi:hypothetical protein
MQQAAENTRDHLAMKFISTVNDVSLTGYLSYDDTHEDNYQRIYGLAQYEQNPDWDQLTDEWTGVPYQIRHIVEGGLLCERIFLPIFRQNSRLAKSTL